MPSAPQFGDSCLLGQAKGSAPQQGAQSALALPHGSSPHGSRASCPALRSKDRVGAETP